MLNSPLFYCKNKHTYPPFKNGLYLEEYFLNNKTETKRKYIPILWTNFQIEEWFNRKKNKMQLILDDWVKKNPSEYGYFIVIQYDEGPLLQLPPNTLIYGACSGNIPIPLIYQDNTFTLENKLTKLYSEKEIFCSFVGTVTHDVRKIMSESLSNNNLFKIILTNGWTPNIDQSKQNNFIDITINSKFALAPRGYGRSSFRFFEIFKLKTIPIYIWDDIDWLPFKETINYSKLCISLNIKDINKLESILQNISEQEYNSMLNYYQEIKQYFYVDGMCKLICSDI